MFFDSWENLYRLIMVGIPAYIGLILLLRMSGNRTLSKMNAFDLVVTVAFGSTLSTILVNKDVSLAVGLLALVLLVILQFAISWSAVRSAFVSGAVKTTPTVLLLDGKTIPDAMRRARVTKDEILAAIRQHGHGSLEDIDAVILEADGSLSVVSASQSGNRSAYGALVPPRQ